jgi:hypothetical protein
MSYETAVSQWQEGERRLAHVPPEQARAAERVTQLIVAELRRRLGGRFMIDELVDLYEQGGTDWCLDLAYKVAPGAPASWDARTVGDAAFLRYMREASDYAGGRRIARTAEKA